MRDRHYEDYYWLNRDSRTFLERGYLREGQSPEHRVEQIANRAEELLGIEGYAKRFIHCMSRGWFSLASPIWANFGLERGLPISCNGSYIPDDMEGILSKNSEIGMMTKHGAGTSAYFGELRGRGAPIKDGGKSMGAVHFMELFDKTTSIVSQSNVRRGQCAAYLPVDHPDIEEFLTVRSEGHPIQKLSVGVCISDAWMEEMIAGDEQKRGIWTKILQSRFESGYPYLFFTDNVNKNAPQVYKDKGMEIFASNLCVAGDQRIPTDRGLLTAETLYAQGGKFKVTCKGETFEALPMRKVHDKARLFKVELENGLSHTVTEDHRILCLREGQEQLVRCADLRPGDKVVVQGHEGLFGLDSKEDEAFLTGIRQGDRIVASLFADQSDGRAKEEEKVTEATDERLPAWVWVSDEATQWQYVRGLFWADANLRYIRGEEGPTFLFVFPAPGEFLEELQILLLNLGVSLTKSTPAEEGESTDFSEVVWRLDEPEKAYKVLSVSEIEEGPAYCCEVLSEEHLFVANGVVTSNCSEIALSSSTDESFVCCLSSLNLLHYDEWKDSDAVQVLTYFLDAVMEEYIQKTEGIPFMEAARNFAVRQRAIGIGVLGWHSYLQSKMLPFESMEAKFLSTEIFRLIDERSLEASKELASAYGEPELLQGYGIRNTTRMAVAPTASSSFILGQVSASIEPLVSNYFIQDLDRIKTTYKNPYLVELLQELGRDTKEVWDSILDAGGSVQHLEFLLPEQKVVFATFAEISQHEVVVQASIRQRFIDQGQSLNLMISYDASAKEVSDLLIKGWRLGIKTFYYQKGVNPSQTLSQSLGQSLSNCKACES